MQVCILLALVYVPFLQPLFNTAPLSSLDWAGLYSLAAVVLIVEELRKVVVRKKQPLIRPIDNASTKLI